jgi:hypothetical protein
MRHGAFVGTGGGFSPVVLTVDLSVTVDVPPGPLTCVSDLTLLSSKQPEIPIPKPIIRAPINRELISFRMAVALDLEDRGGQ